MGVFEIVIAMLVAGAALAALARRIGAPYPALVALAGAGLAVVPGLPTLVMDPELALALFVAPVLLDAAFDSSPRDLRANWRPIASLALGAVVLTIGVVAVVAHLLVPQMPWAAAIALGAIVAPPDAAAATTVLKQLRPPHQLLVILEGESLFNDASALLVYRLAIGATIATFTPWKVLPTLVVVTLGSIVLAFALSRVTLRVSGAIHDVATSVVFQFCATFLVWILAENLHLSGIITMVVYAMLTARLSPETLAPRLRIPSFAVWEVAVFVLNVLAFILVGFQLKTIAARVTVETGTHYAAVSASVCVAVILARMSWVTIASAVDRWLHRMRHGESHVNVKSVALSGREAMVVGWCGMRGTVTLAAALALPTNFPTRDVILATAFGVTLGTLVLQGLTLRPLMLRLRLEDDGTVDREVRLARVETLRSGLAAIEEHPGAEAATLVRHRFELQLRRAEARARKADAIAKREAVKRDVAQREVPEHEVAQHGPAHSASAPGGLSLDVIAHPTNESVKIATDVDDDDDAEIVRAAAKAQRQRLIALREESVIGDAAFQRVEEELDWTEMGWAQITSTR